MKMIRWIMVALLMVSCGQGRKAETEMRSAGAAISFADTLHRFGIVPMAEPVDSCDFAFTNTGTGWLVILGVEVSCDCTRAEYEQRPVGPGEKSYVRVFYDGREKGKGYFRKSVRVTSNAGNAPVVELCVEGEQR